MFEVLHAGKVNVCIRDVRPHLASAERASLEMAEYQFMALAGARFNTSSTTPPPDPAGLDHFMSSPVIVIVRF